VLTQPGQHPHRHLQPRQRCVHARHPDRLDGLVDDAAALLSEPVDLSGYRLPIPRTYIHLADDHCYPPDLQARSSERTEAETVTLRAGHMAMVTIPGQVAAVLNRLHGTPSD
jgi:hypothetical protein